MIKLLRRSPSIWFALFVLWIIVEYFILGPWSYVEIHDVGDSFLTRYLVAGSNLLQHGFSYWLPQLNGGVDTLANDLPLFNPFQLLFSILPMWVAYPLALFIFLYVLGYFTYRLCRDVFSTPRWVGTLAGMALVILIFRIVPYSFGVYGFPLFIWVFYKLVQIPSYKRYWLAVAVGGFFGLVSSVPFATPFIIVLVFLWFILVQWKERLMFLPLLAVAAVTLIVVQLPSFLAVRYNLAASHRANWDYASPVFYTGWGDYLQQVWLAILVFLIFLLYFCYYTREFHQENIRHHAKQGLAIAAMYFFVGVLGPLYFPIQSSTAGIFKAIQSVNLGRFSTFTPFFLVIGLSILCSTFFLHNIKWSKYKKGLVILIFLSLFVVNLKQKEEHLMLWLRGSNQRAAYEDPALIDLRQKTRGDIFRVATFAHSNWLHPAYANAYGFETIDGYVNLYSSRFHSYWGKVIEPLTKRKKDVDLYFNTWGNRAYLFPDESVDNPGGVEARRYFNLALLSLANTKYLISAVPLHDDQLRLVTYKPGLEWGQLLGKRIIRFRPTYIYENDSVLPRIFSIRKVRTFVRSEELLKAMNIASVEELRETAFLDQGVELEEKLLSDKAVTRITKYLPDVIRLAVDSKGPTILILSQNYSEFWHCSDSNGKGVPLYPADHTFWGLVFREAYTGEVECRYNPPYAVL